VKALRLLLVALIMATGLVVGGGGPAYACSCQADVPIERSLAENDAAFVGVYTGRDDPQAGGPVLSSARRVVNHFKVERSVKGDIGAEVDVGAAAGGATCGLELSAGERTGLLLRRDGAGKWTSSLCSQVSADELLAFAPAGPKGSGRDWGFIVFAGLLALAIPVAFVVGGFRRRD
jgi:hypothetical protein